MIWTEEAWFFQEFVRSTRKLTKSDREREIEKERENKSEKMRGRELEWAETQTEQESEDWKGSQMTDASSKAPLRRGVTTDSESSSLERNLLLISAWGMQ